MPNNLDYLDSEGLNALWNRIRTRTLALQSSINELNTNKIELVSFDTTTGVLQQIKNNVASSIVSASVLKTAMNLTKADVGLSGVDDNADENVIEIVKVNGSALTVNSVDKSVNVILPSAASSAPLMDGSVSVGASDAYARADHRHPSDTTRAPQVHTSLTTTYGGATPTYLGHVKLTDTLNSQYTAETYTATTPSAVYNALVEAKAYADDIAEAASVGEPNVIENITINGGRPLQVWNKTVDIDLTTNLVNGTTPGTIKRVTAIPEEQGYILGDHAAALGRGTYAEGDDQTVIGRFNILTGTYVADEDPEICHYKYNIGDYTLGTWKDAPIPQYFIFDEIVSIELANRPPGSTQPDYEDDSRILGECDFKLENGILKIRYPKEEEESGSESGTEGDGDNGGSEGGTTLLPYEPTEPTSVIMDAYIWVNYRSGTYVPDNTYAFVIGNGTSNSHSTIATSRSNALTVDWDGNLVTSGNVYAGGAQGADSAHVEIGNSGVEIYHDTPYIDFHFGNSTADYTSRIIEETSGSLTLKGSYFIAPVLQATSGLILGTSGMTGQLQGVLSTYYDTTLYPIINNYKNGNITVDACSGALHLGYANTTQLNFMHDKLYVDTAGNIQGAGNKTVIRPNIDTWLRINDQGSYTAGTYFGTGQVRTDGYFQVGGANPNTQYRNGSIEFTGDVAKATAPSATQYKNIVFLDNGGRDSYHRLAFIEHYKTTTNENVLQFGVYNHMAGTGSNSWPVGMRFTINSSQSYFAQIWGNTTVSGSLLTSSGRLYSRLASGEAQIQADNNGNNKIYMYANSDGRVGIWHNTADGSKSGAILSRANNTSVVIFGSGNGNAQIYGWTGSGVPLIAPDMANKRVSYFVGYSSTSIAVHAQFNESSYSTRFISTNSSDARLKKYIKDTDVKALPLINSIQMRQFDWKNGEGHQCIGMIADELEQLDDRLSIGGGYDEDGNMNVKSIDTFYLIGYLVKAVQELSAEVDMLKKS